MKDSKAMGKLRLWLFILFVTLLGLHINLKMKEVKKYDGDEILTETAKVEDLLEGYV